MLGSILHHFYLKNSFMSPISAGKWLDYMPYLRVNQPKGEL